MSLTFPEDYIAHDGGECPVDPETFVDCIIVTCHNDDPNDCEMHALGHSGIMRAKYHVWPWSEHPDGRGRVVAYRLDHSGEDSHVNVHKRTDLPHAHFQRHFPDIAGTKKKRKSASKNNSSR